MAVMIDRAEGGASMQSGELEVMVHRRTLLDDARGVAEPLNETQCGCLACHCDGLIARGSHHILLKVILPSLSCEVLTGQPGWTGMHLSNAFDACADAIPGTLMQ